MKRGLVFTGILICCSTAATAEPGLSGLNCEHQGNGPIYDCTFTLADKSTGAPVTDAEFQIKMSMPSMPMAHNAPPIEAIKGDVPGTYHARLPLDMYGTWRLNLKLTEPEPAQLDRTINFVK